MPRETNIIFPDMLSALWHIPSKLYMYLEQQLYSSLLHKLICESCYVSGCLCLDRPSAWWKGAPNFWVTNSILWCSKLRKLEVYIRTPKKECFWRALIKGVLKFPEVTLSSLEQPKDGFKHQSTNSVTGFFFFTFSFYLF